MSDEKKACHACSCRVGSPADKHPAEQSPRSGLSERVSMKLPAELFTGTGKTRKKETVDPSFFDCLGIGATSQK